MRDFAGQFGIVTRWVFALAGVCFVFVPRHAWSSIWGEWYTLGCPLPALALKIGYMSPESPRGLHLQFHPYIVFNAALWLVVFDGIRRAVRARFLSRGHAVVAGVLAFLVGGAWFTYGAVSVINVLIAQSH